MIWLTIYYFYSIILVYNAYVLRYLIIKMSKANKQNQLSSVILMMIQNMPCKQAQICHVVVESNLCSSYASVLLHCIDTVMTRVLCRPFRLIHSFDCNGFLHVLFVVKIIRLPLSTSVMYANTCSEWINLNGLHNTLVITVSMQWSNTDA